MDCKDSLGCSNTVVKLGDISEDADVILVCVGTTVKVGMTFELICNVLMESDNDWTDEGETGAELVDTDEVGNTDGSMEELNTAVGLTEAVSTELSMSMEDALLEIDVCAEGLVGSIRVVSGTGEAVSDTVLTVDTDDGDMARVDCMVDSAELTDLSITDMLVGRLGGKELMLDARKLVSRKLEVSAMELDGKLVILGSIGVSVGLGDAKTRVV